MDEQALLRIWEGHYFGLSPDLRRSFLARPEVAGLIRFSDPSVESALAAHQRLHTALQHARWFGAKIRPSGTPVCGCADESNKTAVVGGERSNVHRLSIRAGPNTRTGFSGPSSPTFVGRCSCGWERRGGSESMVRVLWVQHHEGDEPP